MSKKVKFVLPITGEILPLSEVNDYLFNKKLLGEGAAIQPSESYVVSPVDGKVEALYEAKHAIIIKSTDGLEILIHVGLDTVKLEGRGFGTYVKVGDEVKAGDKILFFDKDYIEKRASLVTPIVITNSDKIESFEVNYHAKNAGDEFAYIALK
ncbi:MAG: PTS glucose transporter subunit IIA [Bacillota bacterium]|nr:PTS glucose transporter subunit IIA [Bacillota bacterium]